jgi:hypothetical protein
MGRVDDPGPLTGENEAVLRLMAQGSKKPKRIVELRFNAPVSRDDVVRYLTQVTKLAEHRGAKSKGWALSSPQKYGRQWLLVHLSRKAVDVLAGYLLGQGFRARVREWERSESPGDPGKAPAGPGDATGFDLVGESDLSEGAPRIGAPGGSEEHTQDTPPGGTAGS